MGSSIWIIQAAVVFIMAFHLQGSDGGKILVYPVDGSHWVNMNLLIEGLHARGHNITVLRSTTSWYVKEKSPHYTCVTIQAPSGMVTEDQSMIISFLAQMIKIQREGASLLSFLSFQQEMTGMLSRIHWQTSQLVREMFENLELMQELRTARFDVVLTDPGLPAGVLLAHRLKLPLIYNVRWITSGEAHFLAAPSPISYIPVFGSLVPDNMTFIERGKNLYFYTVSLLSDMFAVSAHYHELCREYFGPDANFYHLLQSADIWLVRSDFVFEFPRPTMPNIVYVGGFQCKPSRSLPQELEEFVQSSGEHGVVLMSLGTLVTSLPTEITVEIAAAFAQLPQKVIWRHVGDPPPNLGNNTLLLKWLPQNDLLGHPKVKAFVAHGGTNGVYEAIYHGVPVVGLPLLFDQFDNVLRLEVRGAAKVLDPVRLTRQSFLEAIQQVLQQPSYHNSMQQLSRLHRDTPIRALDSAFFWIEFVMRHKGAAHLRSESYRMPWYSYHSVDVAVVLLAGMMLTIVTAVGVFYLLCKRLCKRQKPKQN